MRSQDVFREEIVDIASWWMLSYSRRRSFPCWNVSENDADPGDSSCRGRPVESSGENGRLQPTRREGDSPFLNGGFFKRSFRTVPREGGSSLLSHRFALGRAKLLLSHNLPSFQLGRSFALPVWKPPLVEIVPTEASRRTAVSVSAGT